MSNDFDFLGFDHVEFYVGSAGAWSYLHEKGLGFSKIAYRGPETGTKDTVSHVLRQGEMTLVFTGALDGDSQVANHVRTHGDGVRDVSLSVVGVDGLTKSLRDRGGHILSAAQKETDGSGALIWSRVGTYGDTVHTLIDRSGYKGSFMPGFIEDRSDSQPTGLYKIDHVVGNVEEGNMDRWVDYYSRVFGFTQLVSFDDKDISTEYSALRSKVVHDGKRRVVLPINEPAPGKKKSQIQEFLDYYGSPGVQHIAVRTDDIIHTVTEMKKRGIGFLDTPDTYYERLSERVGGVDEAIEELRRLRILVDRDDKGYMLQIFTKPVCDRPTFFYEIIQRKGAESFGKGNFKALFESIEREQAKRGNL